MSSPLFIENADNIALSGEWTLAALMADAKNGDALKKKLSRFEAKDLLGKNWDLLDIEQFDSAAALLLWRAWQGRWPSSFQASPSTRAILERVAALPLQNTVPVVPRASFLMRFINALGGNTLSFLRSLADVVGLLGRLMLDILFLFSRPQDIPWKEFSANIYRAGAQALPVSALMGFLIGITISYLSALQLKIYGADLFIINILGISIIRELGPVLAAILVAGRSGSAMTAQIGVMRVTEEIDALAALGVSRSIRIILPKVLALTIVMPLLVAWSSACALLGGALAAWLQLDLSLLYFFSTLPKTVPLANLWIGLSKGMAFGFLIALIACQFGLHVRPNTESLSTHTTASVVTSITLVILVDALFAVLTRGIGVPG